ncbi:MAG: DNA-protecting protein DprA [Bacteroidetes bacterium CG12_big_fil_rev_8_21_14_0_65_60_17]|nr:MAG: DNA-protecting protein DprA [Bacteroidetes bacterium CG12_big_fil_rev_8_21_14_0_65_60_17]
MTRLDAAERDARLRLMQADGVGPAAIKVLAGAVPSAEEALRVGVDAWRALGLSDAHVSALDAAAHNPVEVNWPDGWDLYWPADEAYPGLLAAIDDPPMIWVRGNVAMLHQFCTAIVGTRKCSDYGRRTASMLSGALVAAGACVVSGLAYGIDAAAHRGALEEHGSTVAVMGCGPGRVYPGGHRTLQRQIAEQGALVSEFLPGAKPAPWHFPRRNRIISGLCRATIVVEAYDSGGALATAARAREQERDIFVVPGSIEMPMARGSNRLLADGASPVVSPMDLVDRLRLLGYLPRVERARRTDGGRMEDRGQSVERRGHGSRNGPAPLPGGLTDGEERILKVLSTEKLTPEVIMDRARILPLVFWSALARLEAARHVRILPGGRYGRSSGRGPGVAPKKRASRSTPPGDRLA